MYVFQLHVQKRYHQLFEVVDDGAADRKAKKEADEAIKAKAAAVKAQGAVDKALEAKKLADAKAKKEAGEAIKAKAAADKIRANKKK